MAFRSDLDAAHARTQSLERRIRDLEAENNQLRGGADAAAGVDNFHRRLGVGFALLLVVGAISCVLFYQAEMYLGVQLIAAFAVASAVILGLVREFVHVVPPGFALVLSGRSQKSADGTLVGFKVVVAGRVVRIPILEAADLIDCRYRNTEFHISGAYSEGGGPHDVRGMLEYRLSARMPFVGNAVERFLGRDLADVDRVARESMEGHMRSVIARVTAEQLCTNNELVVQKILEECDEDMAKLGMEVGALTITVVQATASS